MKHRKTIITLTVILFGLGTLATWDEWQSKKDDEVKKLKNRITLLSPEDVVRIEYRSTAEPDEKNTDYLNDPQTSREKLSHLSVAAVKKDGLWTIEQPVRYPGDQSSIESLIKTLTEYTYTQEINTEQAKWGSFGLEDPHRVIVLTPSEASKKEPLTVYIGNKAPVGYNVYLRTSSSNQVYLGSQHLLISTAKSLFDFENKEIVAIDPLKMTSLLYERESHDPILIEKNEDNYRLKQPENGEGDRAEIESFVAELNGIRATSVNHSPNPQLIALFTKPTIKITWKMSKDDEGSLTFVKDKGKWLAARDPSKEIFGLGDEPEQKLSKNAIDFRNRRILSTDILNVKTVEIDGSRYHQVDGNWYKIDPAMETNNSTEKNSGNSEKPQEVAYIRTFMVDLEFAKTDKFLPLESPEAKKYVLGAPVHDFKLTYSQENKPPLTIQLFDSDDKDKFYVKRSDQKILYRVLKSTFKNMTATDQNMKTFQEEEEEEEVPEIPLESSENQG